MYLASRSVHVEDDFHDEREEVSRWSHGRRLRSKCWNTPDCGCPICEPREPEEEQGE